MPYFPPSSSSSFLLTETEIDFGSTPVSEASFTVTNALITALSKIMVTPSGNTATSRVGNDYSWEAFSFSALAAAGTFTLYANCSNGSVVGKRKIFYTYS